MIHKLAILDSTDEVNNLCNQRWELGYAFNGCIYNFKELRSNKNEGYHFISDSDTEVIAEGFSEYGTSFVERFNGMFAIGAWNINEEKLYLIRDRYGIKPFYCSMGNSCFFIRN